MPRVNAGETAIDGYSAGERVADVPIARAAPPGTFFDHGVLHLLTTIAGAYAAPLDAGTSRPGDQVQVE